MFKFNLFKAKEYKMIQHSTGTVQFVLDTAVQIRMENGWVLYVDEQRDAPDYYVPDIFQFFGRMSFGKIPVIKLIECLFRVHKSYKTDLNFLNVAWGTLSLGKLPSITFIANIAQDWYEDLTDIARFVALFVAGLAITTPIIVFLAWLVVQYLLTHR